jgi:hypothetical protein
VTVDATLPIVLARELAETVDALPPRSPIGLTLEVGSALWRGRIRVCITIDVGIRVRVRVRVRIDITIDIAVGIGIPATLDTGSLHADHALFTCMVLVAGGSVV